jgi:ABC-2 type transport system permease protein
MRRIGTIAKREYYANVRTKAFIISMVLMPIMMGGGVIAQRILKGRVDLEEKRLLVFDRTSKLVDDIMESAAARNAKDMTDPKTGRQIEAKFTVEVGAGGELSDEQRLALSERIRRRELFAFAEIGPQVISDPTGQSANAKINFYAEGVGSRDMNRWFTRAVNQAIQARRLEEARLDADLVRRATMPCKVEDLGLYARTKAGEIRKADEAGRRAAMMVPIAVMMLMFMAIMMSQTMMQNTLEEKQQRIAEVLLGSATPFELMAGKLLGNVGVSITMVGVYLAGGTWLLHYLGYGDLLRNELVGWFLVYQVLGVLIFGSIFVAIGAMCNELKEAQNYLMPVILLIVMPMMVWFKVLEEPMSRFAVALSLFPPCTPMLMLLRMSATSAVPLWQPLAGIAGTLLMTALCVWAGGRIFRVGLLMQGKPPKLSDLVRFALRG